MERERVTGEGLRGGRRPAEGLLAKVRAIQHMERRLGIEPVTTTAAVVVMTPEQRWALYHSLRQRVDLAEAAGDVRPPLFGGAA